MTQTSDCRFAAAIQVFCWPHQGALGPPPSPAPGYRADNLNQTFCFLGTSFIVSHIGVVFVFHKAKPYIAFLKCVFALGGYINCYSADESLNYKLTPFICSLCKVLL